MLTNLRLIWLLACLSLLFMENATAQQTEPEVHAGVIRRVTLYRGQALVTRVIEIPAGEEQRKLLIGRLPERFTPDSVYAEGNATTAVHGIRVTERTADKADDAARSWESALSMMHRSSSSGRIPAFPFEGLDESVAEDYQASGWYSLVLPMD